MTSFAEEDGTVRIPATSPCRRDYQLRSPRAGERSEFETSSPQSPWQPRGGEMSAFRLESDKAPLDRWNSYGAQQGVSRSYYSGPLPSPSPLPSYFSGGGARGNGSQQLAEASSFSGRLPEVGSSRESSCSEEERVSVDDEVGEVLYTSYLNKGDERSTPRSTPTRSSRMMSPLPVNSFDQKVGMMRNCVSGELGMRFELAQERAQVARGYKSAEIVGLEIGADGVYPKSDIRNEVEALVKGGREISIRRQMQSESLWEALNDAENDRPNCGLAMVPVPFKWEEVPEKVKNPTKNAYSRSFSISGPAQISSKQKATAEMQIRAANERSRQRFYGSSVAEKAESEHWSESEVTRVAPAAAKLQKSSSVSSTKSKSSTPEDVLSYAVPFKWEVEPGKPKVDENSTRSPKAMPTLQLPPRLASSSSMKRTSWSASAPLSRKNSMSTALGNRARSFSASATSTSSSVGKHSLRLQEERHSSPQPSPSSAPLQKANPRRTLAAALRSGPSDNTGRPNDVTPKGGSVGPISSQFKSPQHQNAESLCEYSVSWSRVRSPTSTLCGPASDSHSTPSSCKSDKSSRKSSVSFSHSQSGTSAESFEQWSYGDHTSPTSRHPSIRELPESEGFLPGSSVRGPEEVDQIPAADGAMTKLRRKLSSFKAPMSPHRSSLFASAASSRSVDGNGYSSHGEEYFDCQPGSGSSPLPSSDPKDVQTVHSHREEDQAEVEPPTRLPYKMPSPVEPDAVSAPSSPARAVPDFSNCLALPRFLSKGESPCLWVDNLSWDMPNAPTNTVEDGYRSPAYKATLELLSPSPNLMSKKSGSRVSKLRRSSSARRRHPHLLEVLCNSLKQSLQRCTKRSVARTQSIILYKGQFA